MKRLTPSTVLLMAFAMLAFRGEAWAVLINFDDVIGSQVDITTRYAGQGVTLNAIANPFPIAGTFPASATVPTALGGATTWIQGFGSATSAPQVAVSAPTQETGQAGNGGILITFAFDVSSVSLVGNDLGTGGGGDDESVTLTAYDAAGNLLGQTFSNTNLPAGLLDQTPATISFPGMRFVAYNYTDTQFGFYAIDDLQFTTAVAVVSEPAPFGLIGMALAGFGLARRRNPN